jgi:hypothetical protein
MKKITSYSLVVLVSAIIVGCGGNEEQENVTTKEKTSDNNTINATTNIASNVDTKSTNNTNIAQLDKPEKKKKGFDFDSFAEAQKQSAIDPQEERRKAEEKKKNEEKNKRSKEALAKFNYANEIFKITEEISSKAMPKLVSMFDEYNNISEKTTSLTQIKEWDENSIKSLNKHIDEINEKLDAFITMSKDAVTWKGDMSYSFNGGSGSWFERTLSPEALNDKNELQVTPNSYALYLIVNQIRENNGLTSMLVNGKPFSGIYFEKEDSEYWEKRKNGKSFNLETKKQRMSGLLKQLVENFSQFENTESKEENEYAEIGANEFIAALRIGLKNDIKIANDKYEQQEGKKRLAGQKISEEMESLRAKRISTLQKLKTVISQIKQSDTENISESLNVQFKERIKDISSNTLSDSDIESSDQLLSKIHNRIEKINEDKLLDINYFNFQTKINDGDKNYNKDVADTIITVLNIESPSNEIETALEKLSNFQYPTESDSGKFKNLILDYIVIKFSESEDLLFTANANAYIINKRIVDLFSKLKLFPQYNYVYDGLKLFDENSAMQFAKVDARASYQIFIGCMNNLDKNNLPKKFEDIIKTEDFKTLRDYMDYTEVVRYNFFNNTVNAKLVNSLPGLGGQMARSELKSSVNSAYVNSGDISCYPVVLNSTLKSLLDNSFKYNEFSKSRKPVFYSFFEESWKHDDKKELGNLCYYLERETGIRVQPLIRNAPDGSLIRGICFPSGRAYPANDGITSRLGYKDYLNKVNGLVTQKTKIKDQLEKLQNELNNNKKQLSTSILDDEIDNATKLIEKNESEIAQLNVSISDINYKINVNIELCSEMLDFPKTQYYWERKTRKISALCALTTVHQTKNSRTTAYITGRISKIISDQL